MGVRPPSPSRAPASITSSGMRRPRIPRRTSPSNRPTTPRSSPTGTHCCSKARSPPFSPTEKEISRCPHPGHPTLRYRVRFAGEIAGRSRTARRAGAEHLAFPQGHEDVRALAKEVAGDAGTDRERAERILRFFGSGFRYSLSDPAPSIREFLFRKRAGHCEHYAAGLALLLRGAGIPSRVAAGYLGGEWNGVGKYLIVRQSDAHAWVEAWIDGRWATLDATPAAGDSSPFRTRTGVLGLYADWLRQRWDKYVVNYSLGMQADAVRGGIRAVRRTGTAFPVPGMGWDRCGGAARRGRGAHGRSRVLPALRFLRKRREFLGRDHRSASRDSRARMLASSGASIETVSGVTRGRPSKRRWPRRSGRVSTFRPMPPAS